MAECSTDCCSNDLPYEASRDPFARLTREHSAALLQLRVLDEASHALRAGYAEDAHLRLNMAIAFIDGDVRQHNEKEERFLFPVMEKHGTVPTALFVDEHRTLWSAYSALRETAKDIKTSGRGEELVRRAMEVVTTLTDHIAKENDMLFPLAKSILTPQEVQQLAMDLERTMQFDTP